MDISSLYSLGATYLTKESGASDVTTTNSENGFSKIYQAALGMVNEASSLELAAQDEEMKWAMGLTENAHDLTIAQKVDPPHILSYKIFTISYLLLTKT